MGASIPLLPAKKFGPDKGIGLLIWLNLWLLHFFDSRFFVLEGIENSVQFALVSAKVERRDMFLRTTDFRSVHNEGL